VVEAATGRLDGPAPSTDDSDKRDILVCFEPDPEAAVDADTVSLRLVDEADCGLLVDNVGPLFDARGVDAFDRGADRGLARGVVTGVEWKLSRCLPLAPLEVLGPLVVVVCWSVDLSTPLVAV